ncbi:hypothetical protein HC031_26990 [Planosporangium thailandense]|uniref:Uncharacterized protein n=1 Tax=Planosporangium thailandense TaxID=765197 RepID=A0ABX0Y7T2_9ACTN|nr:hypothetical protein [Planosporangium thailandense]NJC73339.1 hypothetical protein [Planosporangium thailandense]
MTSYRIAAVAAVSSANAALSNLLYAQAVDRKSRKAPPAPKNQERK